MSDNGLYVISRIIDKDVLIGFLVVANNGNSIPQAVSLDAIRANPNVQYVNARYSSEYKTLIGTYQSLTCLPSVTPDYRIEKNNGVVLTSLIKDIDTGSIVGAICFNGIGKQFQFSFKRLIEICSKYKPINFILKNNGVLRVDGKMFPVVELKLPKKEKRIYNSAEGESKPVIFANSKTEQNQIGIIELDAIEKSEFNNSAQEKLLYAMMNMEKLTPYYFCCLQAIKRKPTLGLGTMGVTEDTLYYDISFIAQLSVAELTFVLIHEVSHIAQQHSIRGRNKEQELFNIACDLYINSCICNDFGIYYGEPEKEFNNKTVLKTPSFGCFLETIGETLDLARDTPETIYERLKKENPNGAQRQGQGQQGQGKGQQGQGQQGQGQQGQGKGQQEQGKGQSTASSISDLKSGSTEARKSVNNIATQQGQSSVKNGIDQLKQGLSSGNSQQVQQGLQKIEQGVNQLGSQTQVGQNKMQQALQNLKNNINNGSNNQIQQQPQESTSGDLGEQFDNNSLTETVTVTYNGKKLTAQIHKDVMTNDSLDTKESKEVNMEASRVALQKIKTKKEMKEEEMGEPLLKNAGKGACLTNRYVNFGLSANLDWRTLLKNALTIEHKKMFTLADPNTDYMNMGMTIAGRRKYGKPDKVSGVKICIDVSGSVSKTDLERYISEIAGMFKKYKVEGELIYWSTKVGNAGEIEEIKDMLTINPVTTGGTDVKCVFKYLNKEVAVNEKYEKTKPKDISIIFIITDGVFSHNYQEYEKFGKKVVWLIDGNVVGFDPLFGKVVAFK